MEKSNCESEESPLLCERCVDNGIRECRSSSMKNLVLANFVVCILMVANSFYRPVLSQYVYHRISLQVFGNETRTENFSTLAPCFRNISDPGYVLQEHAQIQSSQKLLQFTVTSSAIAIASNIFLGTYSDSLGRKFLYVTCLNGYLLQTIVTMVIIYFDFNTDFLYLGSALYGVTGGSWSFVLVSSAYTADNTPPKQSRSLWMAVTDSVVGITTGLTSLAAGYFIQNTGYFYSCLTSALINIACIAMVVYCVEETCPRQDRTCISPLQGLRNMFSVYVFKGVFLKRVVVWISFLIFFFSTINNSGGSNLDTLFEMNLPFCWSPEKMGWFNTVTYLVTSLLGVSVLKGLQYCMTDEIVAVMATLSVIGSDVMWSFAYNDWMLYLGAPVIDIVGFAATPIIKGIMSKMVPHDKQESSYHYFAEKKDDLLNNCSHRQRNSGCISVSLCAYISL